MNEPMFADFFDGETARVRRVAVAFVENVLVLTLPDGETVLRWPVAGVRSLSDQADSSRLILGQAGDIDTARLVIEDSLLADVLRDHCPRLKRVDMNRSLLGRMAALSVAAVVSVALIIFVLVPVMADQLAALLPVRGEQALGDSTYEQIRVTLSQNENLGLRTCDAPKGDAALNKMMARLTAQADVPFELKTHVLDHEMVNAFALPGGHVVVLSGLLKNAESPEEVASVLAHELGHVVHRDPSRLALRSAGSIGVLGLLFGDFAGGAVMLFLTERLIQASYSRKAEAAADVFAQELFSEAFLPANAMGDFFERLASDNASDEGLLSHLADHPDMASRAAAARASDVVGATVFEPVLDDAEWEALQSICDF